MRLRPAFLLTLVTAGFAMAAEPSPAPLQGITLSLPGPQQHFEPRHDKIWSGVVLATDVSSPKPPPPELQEFASRLKRVFGYNQLELVGSATEAIDELSESWLVPSPLFPLSIMARRAPSKETHGGYLLNLRLFQQDRPLVDTEAKLGPGSPLFIRGPLYGKGQIILVLQVQQPH
jgi:hypothetical protein